ncbi:hypothetical protein RM844_10305 [Streptomyces sp. DSM 44915]|uniref:ABC transporter n=1 Tax=Streptomyces chisholmiae TaxID=3075540 RepID=A0ABU2JNX5_9ACTN|nr:hypothetical protein [Streptomyces sp. DSM 44915]MDT0266684.1 hypothetical protein [Streptomyces sp. DSM 44915]
MKAGTTARATAAVAALAALLAGCGGTADEPADAAPEPTEEATPHGYVPGAEETAEAQSRLLLADAETGETVVFDLTTEEITEVGRAPEPTGLRGDGRFGYLTTGDGTTHVLDSGAWTVDHGDHVHYYRTEPAALGTVAAAEVRAAHADSGRAALSLADGTVRLLDREELAAGTLSDPEVLSGDGALGAAVPYEEHLLVPGAEAPDTVSVWDADGQPVATVDASCPEPGGAAVTRRGAVFSCADGALLVTAEGDTFSGEKIAYPAGVPAADVAREFTLRPGGDTLTAPAGEAGVLALNLADRAWTLVATGPVVAANAVGDGVTLLTLTADGTLRAHDLTDGQLLASTELLAEPPAEGSAPPVIEIDTSRAYVNDPAAGVVHEVDYQDELRLARTLTPGITPDLMVETGR